MIVYIFVRRVYIGTQYNTVKLREKKLIVMKKKLTQLQREEEKKKLAESETLKMPPPRIDFSFMRSIYTEQIHKSRDDRVNKNRPKNKRDMSPSRESGKYNCERGKNALQGMCNAIRCTICGHFEHFRDRG